MKALVMPLAVALLIGMSISAEARDHNRYGNDGYGSSQDDNQGYKGSFGNQYQYDLSRPSDQIRYESDYGAQLRDEMSISPTRDLERDMGQYGGGIRR
jgi:hypothetical protein